MQGETILCIATRAWHSMWRESQQHMSRMAAHNRVLYFEPGRNPDRPHVAEMRRNWSNFFALRAQEVRPNLFVIPTPSCLPYARRNLPHAVLQMTTPLVAAINARILIRHIRWAMQAFDVAAPILWLYEPRHIDLIGKFGEKLACFYIYDEFHDFVGNERIRDLLRRYYDQLSRQADVVFACSPWIWERRIRLNPNSYCVPNAVDFELFHRALDPQTSIAPDIANLRRPIIGVAGMLDDRIDVELLLRVAEAYPATSLALVGPDRLLDDERGRRLHALPNVFFLGQTEVDRLPSYLKAFDVALIPYLVERHTLPIYPLKLHEYLAAGRAVVGTALPELKKMSHVIRIAETHAGFIEQIAAALHENAAQVIEARLAAARENTWDRRVEDMYSILSHHLAVRKERRGEIYMHQHNGAQSGSN